MQPANSNDPQQTTDHPPPSALNARDESLAPETPPLLPHDPLPLHAVPTDVTSQPTKTGLPADGSSTEPFQPLPSIPGYELLSILGRGGMGIVYKARHLSLKRTVALKMILAADHAGAKERARFRTETEAVARLQHPGIVQIHEVGEHAGHPYCALEFVEGGTLAQQLADQSLPPRAAARLLEGLARAMQLAHSRNVIHRDLKPANVLLTPDGRGVVGPHGEGMGRGHWAEGPHSQAHTPGAQRRLQLRWQTPGLRVA